MSFYSSTNLRLGNLQSFNTEGAGLRGETTTGKFKVTVYSSSIIRVAVTKNESFEDFSYSVVAQPEEQKINAHDAGEQIIVQTKSCKLVIDKNPVKFSFQTLDGKIINEDDSLGISWIGDQVTCYKKLPEGEGFTAVFEIS